MIEVELDRLHACVGALDEAHDERELMGMLVAIRNAGRALSELAAEVALEAVREGATVKDTAACLGVSTSTLRGIRQEAGVA